MKTIVGLGNPGSSYRETRHNVGFRVVERLARRHGDEAFEDRGSLWSVPIRIAGTDLLLVRPSTYMNRSGQAVEELLADGYGGGEDLIVIHDDLDLSFGSVRVKRGGGHGGHNGLRSIIDTGHAGEFLRIRLGIGRAPHSEATIDWVLGRFEEEEEAAVDAMLERGADAVEQVIEHGVERAMTELNRRRPPVVGPERSEIAEGRVVEGSRGSITEEKAI